MQKHAIRLHFLITYTYSIVKGPVLHRKKPPQDGYLRIAHKSLLTFLPVYFYSCFFRKHVLATILYTDNKVNTAHHII